MAKLNNIDKIIEELKKHDYLKEFINLTFNYNLHEDDNIEVYVQHIKDDDVIYIYQIGTKNQIEFFDFFLEDNNIYLEKMVSKGIITNYVYINKCIELYSTNNKVNNLIRFTAAFYLDNKKKILLEYLPEYIVNIIVKY